MEAATHLRVVPQETPEGFDGEATPDNLRLLLEQLSSLRRQLVQANAEIEQREKHEKMLERDIKGKRLRISELEEDRMARALNDPQRPEADVIHALWKKACGKRRPMHAADYERVTSAIRARGFRRCVAAVAGVKYDCATKVQKNGKLKRFDDLELVFREYSKVDDFAARAPKDWAPDASLIARIGGVPEEWVEKLLGEGE